MRFSLIVATFALAGAALGQYSGAQALPARWKTGFDSITESEAKRILTTLAGPDFRGRNSFNGDYLLAAGYVSAELRKIGVKPLGDEGSYFHRLTFVRSVAVREETKLKTSIGNVEIPFGADLTAAAEGSGSYTSSPVTFVHAPQGTDLSKIDFEKFKGQWVLFSEASASHRELRDLVNGLRNKLDLGTKFVFPIERPTGTMPNAPTYTGIKGLQHPLNGAVSPLTLSSRAVKQIADALGAKKFLAATGTEVVIEPTPHTVSIELKATVEEFPLVNVVGIIEGTDPSLKSEAVQIGSHLDHMGLGRSGTLYGADDNASGCTANLLIARAIMANPVKPRRSVIFSFWALEESGLWGSFAYTSRPTFPLDKVIAYINMDMVGRNEEDARFGETDEKNQQTVYPGIVEFNSLDFYNLLVEMNGFVNLKLKKDYEDRTFRSDTGNFVRHGIPTLKAFTGEHRDYHRAGDTTDKINWTKLVNIAKWLYLSTQELALRSKKPKFEMRPFVGAPRGSGG